MQEKQKTTFLLSSWSRAKTIIALKKEGISEKLEAHRLKVKVNLMKKHIECKTLKLKKSPRTTNKKPVLFTNKNIFLFPAKNPLPLGDGGY